MSYKKYLINGILSKDNKDYWVYNNDFLLDNYFYPIKNVIFYTGYASENIAPSIQYKILSKNIDVDFSRITSPKYKFLFRSKQISIYSISQNGEIKYLQSVGGIPIQNNDVYIFYIDDKNLYLLNTYTNENILVYVHNYQIKSFYLYKINNSKFYIIITSDYSSSKIEVEISPNGNYKTTKSNINGNGDVLVIDDGIYLVGKDIVGEKIKGVNRDENTGPEYHIKSIKTDSTSYTIASYGSYNIYLWSFDVIDSTATNFRKIKSIELNERGNRILIDNDFLYNISGTSIYVYEIDFNKNDIIYHGDFKIPDGQELTWRYDFINKKILFIEQLNVNYRTFIIANEKNYHVDLKFIPEEIIIDTTSQSGVIKVAVKNEDNIYYSKLVKLEILNKEHGEFENGEHIIQVITSDSGYIDIPITYYKPGAISIKAEIIEGAPVT